MHFLQQVHLRSTNIITIFCHKYVCGIIFLLKFCFTKQQQGGAAAGCNTNAATFSNNAAAAQLQSLFGGTSGNCDNNYCENNSTQTLMQFLQKVNTMHYHVTFKANYVNIFYNYVATR